MLRATRREPSGGAESARFQLGGELAPGLRREDQLRAVRVLGVAHCYGAIGQGEVNSTLNAGDFDAVPAAAAVAGLVPLDTGQVHILATSSRTSREAALGSASALIVSQMIVTAETSAGVSMICPRAAVSA